MGIINDEQFCSYLCTMLPHKILVYFDGCGDVPRELTSYERWHGEYHFCAETFTGLKATSIKPYLRPMSSMTEEEKLHLELNYGFELHGDVLSNLHIIKGGGYYEREGEYVAPTEHRQYKHITIDTVLELIKWLNAHHFDYCGLIEKGLAIEAPEGMYNF